MWISKNYSEKEMKKIQEFFENLNNYKEFFKDGDFKANKAGTKANLRIPRTRKIVSVVLKKEELEENYLKKVQLTVFSKEINSVIVFKFHYYSSLTPDVSVDGKFRPFKRGFMRNDFVDMFIGDEIEGKIEAKMNELAYT